MNVDFGFLRLARRASLESSCYPRVGAVISTKRPISFGYNKPKTHPKYSNPELTVRDTIHAEMDCLKTVTWDDLFDGATIWVYREANGKPALARPCDDCIKTLRSFEFKRMVYTVDKYPYYKIERLR